MAVQPVSPGLSLPLRALRLAGLWAEGPSLAYSCFSATIVGMLLSVFVMHLLQLPNLLNDFRRAVVCAYAMSAVFCITCKSVGVVVMRRRAGHLLSVLMPRLAASQCHPQAVEAARQARLLSVVMHVMTQAAVLAWILLPLLSPIEQRQLPYDSWHPFNVSDIHVYNALYLYESATLVVIAATMPSVDTFFVSLLIVLIGQIQIINEDFATIHHRSSSGVVELEDRTSTSAEKEPFKQLVAAVKHHQEIISCVSQLEKIMGLPVLAQFLFNLFDICITAVVVVKAPADMEILGKCGSGLLVLMCQNFTYCWFGDKMIDQSERLRFSAFACGWPDLGPRFASSLKIVLMRTQQPLRIKACSIYTLSRETFLMLLQGSYSFFAVFYNMSNKQE